MIYMYVMSGWSGPVGPLNASLEARGNREHCVESFHTVFSSVMVPAPPPNSPFTPQ